MKKPLKPLKDLFRSKKHPSLSYMIKRVKEIADQHNEEFFSVEIIYHSIPYLNSIEYKDVNEVQICIKGYINGFGIVYGLTIDSVCDRLIDYKKKPKESSIIKYVILDLA